MDAELVREILQCDRSVAGGAFVQFVALPNFNKCSLPSVPDDVLTSSHPTLDVSQLTFYSFFIGFPNRLGTGTAGRNLHFRNARV